MTSIRPAGGISVTLPSFPDAACIGADPELFFGSDDEKIRDRRRREARARAICGGCPSRLPCLEWALEYGIQFGIFGGLTEDERKNGPRLCRNRLHPMDARNTRVDEDGHEKCRACWAAAQRRFEAKRAVA